MIVRNTKYITFDWGDGTSCKSAVIHLTPLKDFPINEDSFICHQYHTGWSGYGVISGKKEAAISAQIMRQIAKYLIWVKQDFDYDYYRIPLERISAIKTKNDPRYA